MSRRAIAVLVLTLAAEPALAGPRKPSPPPLTEQHSHPSGSFTFRTPEGWILERSPTNPEAIQVSGDGLLVRFVYSEGEIGYDALHATCMLERLSGPMHMHPRVEYEYDFVGGPVGERRALDSAFVVQYDEPILGHRKWRQRNLTVVGGGESLCAISYAPAKRWKKSAETRALLDAILASVTFRSRP
jgi:hypothetical protein